DLVTLLSSSEPRLREATIEVLSKVGPAALPALEAALKSGSPVTRATAARAWSEVQVGATPRDPAVLLPLLDDPDPSVRQSAAETIADASPAQQETQRAMLA